MIKKIISRVSLRVLIQAAIVALIFYLALAHQYFGIEKAASIDAYCPFGGVESLFTLIFKGEFLKRIFTSSFILLGIFLIATLFLGRVFCGYFCPLGALQEWLRKLGKVLGFKRDLELPAKLDKYLRFAKYLVLLVVVYFSFYLGDLIFRNYDPYNALMHFGYEFEEKIVAYIILLLVLILSLFSKSWWCRYFCPLGAFWALVKKISFFKIKRDADTCISCGICDQKCPANLNVASAKEITDADCISCGLCIKKCPKSSLKFTILGKTISKQSFSILVLVLVVLPLALAPFTPWWQTKAQSNIINSQGEIKTDDIRGSNTLKYLVETTKVPLEVFQDELGLPANVDETMKIKDIGLTYGIKNAAGTILETQDFRDLVAAYLAGEIHESDCPFGETDCSFPGKCGSYIDQDKDRLCDHSQ
ncbi:MAG: 4Fe-4S binding protein [Patescibacteria group bacterium]